MMLRLPMDRSGALEKVRIPVPRAMKTDHLAGDQGRCETMNVAALEDTESVGENLRVQIRELTAQDRDAVVALWHEAALTRPWNDPVGDSNALSAIPHPPCSVPSTAPTSSPL